MTPYNIRKVLLLACALICLSSAACFAESVAFFAVSSTPYDHQMTRIQPYLSGKGGTHSENVSLGQVNQWIGSLRAIPYGFTAEWKTPSEVHTTAIADCKAKAVALYEEMHAAGADNVKLVIGKRTSISRKTHAWLEWTTAAGTYVLDPTINWSAVPVARVGSRNYVPLYAYSGTKKYQANTGALVAKN